MAEAGDVYSAVMLLVKAISEQKSLKDPPVESSTLWRS